MPLPNGVLPEFAFQQVNGRKVTIDRVEIAKFSPKEPIVDRDAKDFSANDQLPELGGSRW
jgi:hypothetical protein